MENNGGRRERIQSLTANSAGANTSAASGGMSLRTNNNATNLAGHVANRQAEGDNISINKRKNDSDMKNHKASKSLVTYCVVMYNAYFHYFRK